MYPEACRGTFIKSAEDLYQQTAKVVNIIVCTTSLGGEGVGGRELRGGLHPPRAATRGDHRCSNRCRLGPFPPVGHTGVGNSSASDVTPGSDTRDMDDVCELPLKRSVQGTNTGEAL